MATSKELIKRPDQVNKVLQQVAPQAKLAEQGLRPYRDRDRLGRVLLLLAAKLGIVKETPDIVQWFNHMEDDEG